MRHRPELDGLRGIAVLIVLAAHAGVPGFRAGAPGVTLFFVLSGFLITALLIAERDRNDRVDLVAFYARRGLRLLPPLFGLLLVVVLLGIWTGSPPDALAIVAVAGYVGNWAQAGGLNLGLLGHTWSLAIEEQFYLLWPALLLVGLRLGGRHRLALAILAVAVLVTPWRLLLWNDGAFQHVIHGTDTHADALLIGCAIALLAVRMPGWVGWLGVVATIGICMAWLGGSDEIYFLPIAVVAAAFAVAGCPTALRWRPLAYVGRISYGLYLWHFLFIWSNLPWPVILVVSFAVSAASYRYLEQPFLRLKDRFARPGMNASSPVLVPETASPAAGMLVRSNQADAANWGATQT